MLTAFSRFYSETFEKEFPTAAAQKGHLLFVPAAVSAGVFAGVTAYPRKLAVKIAAGISA